MGFGIYYTTAQQTKVYIPNVRIANDYYLTNTIIQTAYELKDAEFVVEIEGQTFAKLKIEAAIVKRKCGSWAEISKFYVDGVLTERNPLGGYLLKAK